VPEGRLFAINIKMQCPDVQQHLIIGIEDDIIEIIKSRFLINLSYNYQDFTQPALTS
jgi:hypothetical protein